MEVMIAVKRLGDKISEKIVENFSKKNLWYKIWTVVFLVLCYIMLLLILFFAVSCSLDVMIMHVKSDIDLISYMNTNHPDSLRKIINALLTCIVVIAIWFQKKS